VTTETRPTAPSTVAASSEAAANELRALFHQLNNHIGIILSHAELLEAKADSDANRARATLVVSTVIDALETVRELRRRILPS